MAYLVYDECFYFVGPFFSESGNMGFGLHLCTIDYFNGVEAEATADRGLSDTDLLDFAEGNGDD